MSLVIQPSVQRETESIYTLLNTPQPIRLYFFDHHTVRIRRNLSQNNFFERSYNLVQTLWQDHCDALFPDRRIKGVEPQYEEDAEKIVFSTNSLKLVYEREKNCFSLYKLEDQQLIYSELAYRSCTLASGGRFSHYSLNKEHSMYLGLGEQAGILDRNRRHFRIDPKDAIGYDPETTSPLYKHIPFYLDFNRQSAQCCGVYYHNSWPCEFDFYNEHSGYWPAYNSYQSEGGDLDFFLIYGDRLPEVVQRYTALTGRSYLPPLYSLGYLGSTMYYIELPRDCDQAILGFVERCKRENIPLDGFQLSSGYTVGENNKRYVFTWNKKRVKDPAAFFAAMEKAGAPVSPNLKPGLLLTHPYYERLKESCVRLNSNSEEPYINRWWGGWGSLIDFTNPRGRHLWGEMIDNELIANGIISIWNDNCEYEIDDHGASCLGDGATMSALEAKSIQPNLMSWVAYEHLRKNNPHKRPYVICRSGASGIQRYAQTWAGDNPTGWKSLKYNIATVLGMGLSGVANNGCDIGGFQGSRPSEELLIRWVQNGVFFPRFSIHSANDDNTVTEPWMYGEQTLNYIRSAIQLRYRLISYFYSLLREAAKSGAPLMRPLLYEFASDPHCHEESEHFMLGSGLLVANIVEQGQKEKSVYLPQSAGIWYDFYTYEPLASASLQQLAVSLESIPLYIAPGAIIPFYPQLPPALINFKPTKMRLLCNPSEEGSFTLYQDDGMSNDFEEGAYLESVLNMRWQGEVLHLSMDSEGNFSSSCRELELQILNAECGAFSVHVQQKELTHFVHENRYQEATEGWHYQAKSNSVFVKLLLPEDWNLKLSVNFSQYDLIGM